MKKYIIGAVAMGMLLAGQPALAAFGVSAVAQSAISTNPADPAAPFTLSGLFAAPGGSQGAIVCFQVRPQSVSSYANDCDTPAKSFFSSQASVVGGLGESGFLSSQTARLQADTTYFYRVAVVAGPVRFQGIELSFHTPAAPKPILVPTPTPTPAPTPAPVTTLTVTPDSTQLVAGTSIPNQKLASFSVNVANEPVSVQSISFHIAIGGSFAGNIPAPATSADLTNVTLVDAGGRVLAGPFDVRGTADRVVALTDAVTFPLGLSTYAIKGTVPTNAFGGQSITLSTNLATDWKSPKGVRTGKSISLSGAVRMTPVSVRRPQFDLSLITQNTNRNVIAGSRSVVLETYLFNAAGSSEDIRFSSFAVPFVADGGLASDMTNCQFFDGTTPLNAGLNPATTPTPIAGLTPFVFNQAVTVAKDTSKTLTLKCDIASAARGIYSFDLANSGATVAPTTAITNVAIPVSITPVHGNTVTAVIGTLSLSNDPLSPAGQNITNGSLDFRVGVVKFHAANEPITLSRIGVVLFGTSSPQSVTRLTVTDNGTIVGTAVFTAGNRTPVVTLASPITIPLNGDKQLGIKLDFARVGAALPGVAGDRITIGVIGTSTEGVGTLSGNTIGATGSVTFNTFVLR